MIPKYLFTKFLVSKNTSYFGQSVLKLRRQKQAELAQKIKTGLNATFVSVTDTTIGTSSCGQMYNILVESPTFQGKSRVQQHQLVSSAIEEQLKNIHGFNLKTKIPKKASGDVFGQTKNQEKEKEKQQEKEGEGQKKQ